MVLMHSEDKETCKRCETEFQKIADDLEAKGWQAEADIFKLHVNFALDHYKVVGEWGRYPQRNEALGRESTPEEVEFLKTATRW